jgi:hypothetical protein
MLLNSPAHSLAKAVLTGLEVGWGPRRSYGAGREDAVPLLHADMLEFASLDFAPCHGSFLLGVTMRGARAVKKLMS